MFSRLMKVPQFVCRSLSVNALEMKLTGFSVEGSGYADDQSVALGYTREVGAVRKY